MPSNDTEFFFSDTAYLVIIFLFTYIFSNIIILNSFYNKFIFNLFNKKNIPKKNKNKNEINK